MNSAGAGPRTELARGVVFESLVGSQAIVVSIDANANSTLNLGGNFNFLYGFQFPGYYCGRLW